MVFFLAMGGCLFFGAYFGRKYQFEDNSKFNISELSKKLLEQQGWTNVGLDEDGRIIGNHSLHGNGMLINEFLNINTDRQDN